VDVRTRDRLGQQCLAHRSELKGYEPAQQQHEQRPHQDGDHRRQRPRDRAAAHTAAGGRPLFALSVPHA